MKADEQVKQKKSPSKTRKQAKNLIKNFAMTKSLMKTVK